MLTQVILYRKYEIYHINLIILLLFKYKSQLIYLHMVYQINISLLSTLKPILKAEPKKTWVIKNFIILESCPLVISEMNKDYI
jgi:hypothetical protein